MATVYKVQIDVKAPRPGLVETTSQFRDAFIAPATGSRGNPAFKNLYAAGELLMDYPTTTMADVGGNSHDQFAIMRVEWSFTNEANRDLFFDAQHSQAAVSAEFRRTLEEAGFEITKTKTQSEE
jgi:hypothetical protein